MTNGTTQGLFIIVAIIIFSVFLGTSYFLFKDKLKPALTHIFTDSNMQAVEALDTPINYKSLNGNLYMSLDESIKYSFPNLNTIKEDTMGEGNITYFDYKSGRNFGQSGSRPFYNKEHPNNNHDDSFKSHSYDMFVVENKDVEKARSLLKSKKVLDKINEEIKNTDFKINLTIENKSYSGDFKEQRIEDIKSITINGKVLDLSKQKISQQTIIGKNVIDMYDISISEVYSPVFEVGTYRDNKNLPTFGSFVGVTYYADDMRDSKGYRYKMTDPRKVFNNKSVSTSSGNRVKYTYDEQDIIVYYANKPIEVAVTFKNGFHFSRTITPFSAIAVDGIDKTYLTKI